MKNNFENVFSLWQDATTGYITVTICWRCAINTVWQCSSYGLKQCARSHHLFVLQELAFFKKDFIHYTLLLNCPSFIWIECMDGLHSNRCTTILSTYNALIVLLSILLCFYCMNWICFSVFRLCITPFSSVDGSHSTGTGFESITYYDSRGEGR